MIELPLEILCATHHSKHLNTSTKLFNFHHNSLFPVLQTRKQAQRSLGTCPKSNRQFVTKLGFEPWQVVSKMICGFNHFTEWRLNWDVDNTRKMRVTCLSALSGVSSGKKGVDER